MFLSKADWTRLNTNGNSHTSSFVRSDKYSVIYRTSYTVLYTMCPPKKKPTTISDYIDKLARNRLKEVLEKDAKWM